jgi:hemerythrin
MAIIKWRDSYSVDNRQLDKQHKVLVELINEMFITVRDKKINLSVHSQIEKLIIYTQEHFNYEEKLLEKVGCDFLEHHKEIHKKLLKEAIELKEQIENNPDKISSDLYLFLRNWLIDHILKEDMQYKEYLSEANEEGILSEE